MKILHIQRPRKQYNVPRCPQCDAAGVVVGRVMVCPRCEPDKVAELPRLVRSHATREGVRDDA